MPQVAIFLIISMYWNKDLLELLFLLQEYNDILCKIHNMVTNSLINKQLN